MRRAGLFALLILTAVLFQTTAFSRLTLFGVSPDLILVVVISFALLEGPSVGAVVGFSGGLLRDLLLDSPKGLTGLSYLLVGYIVGSLRPYVQSTSVLVPVGGVFVGSLVGTTLYQTLLVLLGRASLPAGDAARIIVLTSVYNTLLVPFVYPLVRRVSAMYRRDHVLRW